MTDKDKAKKEEPELEVGGKGLAFHGPMLYEVKILKMYNPNTGKVTVKRSLAEGGQYEDIIDEEAPVNEKDIVYFVHYRGWKTTWDEWIGTDRLLPYNEENLKIEKELRKTYLSKKNKRQGTPTARGGKRTNGIDRETVAARKEVPSNARTTKRSRVHDDTLGQEEEYLRTPEIQLSIPSTLKSLLVDDWEYVTKDHKVVPLPRTPTVAEILLRYAEAATPSGDAVSAERETFQEVISGIKLYFDRSLGNVLLYRYERPQLFDIRAAHPDFIPSNFYGAEHLLRLFVALPGLIAQTSMDSQAVSTLRKHLEDFLRFLASHQDEFFTNEYQETRRFPDSTDSEQRV